LGTEGSIDVEYVLSPVDIAGTSAGLLIREMRQ
jgi:hypothetical protein